MRGCGVVLLQGDDIQRLRTPHGRKEKRFVASGDTLVKITQGQLAPRVHVKASQMMRR